MSSIMHPVKEWNVLYCKYMEELQTPEVSVISSPALRSRLCFMTPRSLPDINCLKSHQMCSDSRTCFFFFFHSESFYVRVADIAVMVWSVYDGLRRDDTSVRKLLNEGEVSTQTVILLSVDASCWQPALNRMRPVENTSRLCLNLKQRDYVLYTV